MDGKKIKIGIPKGSLQDYTVKIFRLAGFHLIIPDKGYFLPIDDPNFECFLLRPQEIPRYIQAGKLDCGISGDDWIQETRTDVLKVCDLRYAKSKIQKIRWVLAVAKESGINSVKDLEGKIISTEIVNLAEDYLKKHGVKAQVEFSWGATEAKPPRFVDAIIDLVETGDTLKAHNLKILDTVFVSSTELIAGKEAWQDPFKKSKIESLAMLLKGAVDSKAKVGISMHISKEKLDEVLGTLPRLKKPSVHKMAGINFYDILFVSDRKEARELLPRLKKMGCEGIAEFPLTRIIL